MLFQVKFVKSGYFWLGQVSSGYATLSCKMSLCRVRKGQVSLVQVSLG
jgi:hypothetical protein